MERKKDIETLLKSLKEKGYTRAEIEAELGYSENYIDQALSKGGNQRFLEALRKLNNRVLQKETLVGNNIGTEIQKGAGLTGQNIAYVEGTELLKAITTLTESNKGLVDSNKAIVNTNQTIADTNAILAKKLIKEEVTDDSVQDIPIIETSRLMDLLEVLAEIAFQSGLYESKEKAEREISIRLKLHVGVTGNKAGTGAGANRKSTA